MVGLSWLRSRGERTWVVCEKEREWWLADAREKREWTGLLLWVAWRKGAAAVGGLEERGCKRLWTGGGHGAVTGGLSEGKRREQGKWENGGCGLV